MLSFVLPPLLLSLAFSGAGNWILRLTCKRFPEENALTHFCLAYFLGQGILGVILTSMGLAGLLRLNWLLVIFLPCAASSLFHLYTGRTRWKFFLHARLGDFIRAELPWKLYAILLSSFLLSGFSSLGTPLEGDAIAFYMAYPKLLAYTGKLVPLPGYDEFSQVGLLAETFITALNVLGMPDASARIYSYINFLPALVILMTLGFQVGLRKRGALLLAGAAVTSSCVAYLWGDGKTDLYAVGPALAAFLYATYSWESARRFPALVFTGFLAGMATVFKLSYLPLLGISLCVYAGWPLFFQLAGAILSRSSRACREVATDLAGCVLWAGGGFLLGLFPLVIKNQILFGSWIGITDGGGAFYSVKTTLRIVLTYPLALIFGSYWAQLGNISITYLIAVPFLSFLPKPIWRESKFTAISVAAVAGFLCWIVLFPSYLIPRYILFVLLLAGIPLMGGLTEAARQKRFWSCCVPLAAALVILLVFKGYREKGIIRPMTAARYIQTRTEPAEHPYALAGSLISSQAKKNARVYMLSWHRYWLRPDLLQHATTVNEHKWMAGTDERSMTPESFWERMRISRYTYVMWDTEAFKSALFAESLLAIPSEITVSQLECFERVCVYKIDYINLY